MPKSEQNINKHKQEQEQQQKGCWQLNNPSTVTASEIYILMYISCLNRGLQWIVCDVVKLNIEAFSCVSIDVSIWFFSSFKQDRVPLPEQDYSELS